MLKVNCVCTPPLDSLTLSEYAKTLSDETKPPSADNWVNRSQGMVCGSCRYWVEKKGKRADFGRCRRHAPTMSGWPANFGTDWCGDHKLDENKT